MQAAIDIIEKLMSPKTQGDRDNIFQQHIDIIPQLVASQESSPRQIAIQNS